MEPRTKNLECKLNEYITELENKLDILNACDFPFQDIAVVYSEVTKKLKNIMSV